MSKIVWDATGDRIAETGVKHGVLYVMNSTGEYGDGVAWNGLTSVNEAPTGAEPTPFYADDQKYLEIMSEEEFAGSIGCYTYPDEFKACIGEADLIGGAGSSGINIGQQERVRFGFCYRTNLVNDTSGLAYGYKIHLVYGALAGVSTRDHTTINETPDLEELSFDFTATKVPVTGAKPTAHLVLDSTKIPTEKATQFQAILDALYGIDQSTDPVVAAVAPKLLLPDEVKALYAATG